MPSLLTSIQGRITWLAGLCLLLVSSVLIGLSLYQARQDSQTIGHDSGELFAASARHNLETQGQVQALLIRARLQNNLLLGEGLSRTVQTLRAQQRQGILDPAALRNALNQAMAETLGAHPELLGLFLVFQPDALDAADAQFAAREDLGSNETGRFALYLLQNGKETQRVIGTEQVLGDATPGPSGQPYNAFFTCSTTHARPCVLDPYFDEASGQRRLVTSVTLPVLENGKAIAAIGFDIDLATLQQSSVEGSRSLFDGQGRIRILSPNGLVASDSGDASKLGQKFGDKTVLAEIAAGRSQSSDDGESINVLHSLAPVPDAAPWGILLSVPRAVMLAPAERLKGTLDDLRWRSTALEIGIGVAAGLLGMLLVALTALGISRPILRLARMLEDIADGEGDLTRRLDYPRRDELGRLATAFNRFLDKLQPSIAAVQSATREAHATADRSAQIAGRPATACSSSSARSTRSPPRCTRCPPPRRIRRAAPLAPPKLRAPRSRPAMTASAPSTRPTAASTCWPPACTRPWRNCSNWRRATSRSARSWKSSAASPRRPTCWPSTPPSKRRAQGTQGEALPWSRTKCAGWPGALRNR